MFDRLKDALHKIDEALKDKKNNLTAAQRSQLVGMRDRLLETAAAIVEIAIAEGNPGKKLDKAIIKEAKGDAAYDIGKLDNALDQRYSRALYSFDGSNYGYREEGRTWMLGVTWTPEF